MQEGTTRIAAISGGLGDIGQACATTLASLGADIAICDEKAGDRVGELRRKVERLGRRFHFAQVDVADDEAVRGWFEAIERELGVADIAIVNAAIVELCNFDEMTAESWQRHLDVNLTGGMNVANTAASRMAAAGVQGSIVLLGSWAAAAPHVHIPAYCVTKAGVRMLGQLLALHYAAKGIRVNEVAPGLVDAGMSRELFQKNPALRERMASQVPLGRLMTADEVAWQVSQLCHPTNANTTGATITCDGGISLITAAERK
jgi:NAD(P)-dependent dehydrogenase (short-subunit alcohol dehydrogenase family)